MCHITIRCVCYNNRYYTASCRCGLVYLREGRRRCMPSAGRLRLSALPLFFRSVAALSERSSSWCIRCSGNGAPITIKGREIQYRYIMIWNIIPKGGGGGSVWLWVSYFFLSVPGDATSASGLSSSPGALRAPYRYDRSRPTSSAPCPPLPHHAPPCSRRTAGTLSHMPGTG